MLSIIIVNYNGRRWLEACLESLSVQNFSDFEIILVDNGSRDDSVLFVKTNFPEVKIVQSETNLGFAGGNNLGFKEAKGDYIYLLNNDTYIDDRDFLTKFIKVFEEIPNLAVAQSKIVLMKNQNKLDCAGSFWTDSTFLYHYGFAKKENDPKYNRSFPVFSVKGASMLTRREIIEKIGLFDNDFGSYYEETDFCHRAWLSGYECWYYPEVEIIHAMGGTSIYLKNSEVQFNNFKNKLLSFLKNFEVKTLIKILPIYFAFNFLLSLTWIFRGKTKHAFAIYRALGWNIKNFRQTIKKRKAIQLRRTKKDREIFQKVKKNPRLIYYYHLLNNLENYQD